MRQRLYYLGFLVFLLVLLLSTEAQAKDKKHKGRTPASKPKVERCTDCIDYLKIREDYFKEQEYDEDGLFDEEYHITTWRSIGKCPTPTIYDSPLCTGSPYDFA